MIVCSNILFKSSVCAFKSLDVDDDDCCRGLGVENNVEFVEDVVVILLLVVEENENVDFAGGGLGALPLLDEEAKENAGFVEAEDALEVNVTLPNGLVGFVAAGGGSFVVAKGLLEDAAAFGCCCCKGGIVRGADGGAAAPTDPPPPPKFRLSN